VDLNAIPMLRLYDKGERRHKHVGKGPNPTIEFDTNNPKKWVGKCPSTLSQVDRDRLLNEAVAAPNGDRELDIPKKVYTVHEGAIYEAQTSDQGHSYHGYPYRGKLSGAIVGQLRAMAIQKNCLAEFNEWTKKHIELHGPRQ
jgi:hypothetical protein